MIRLQFPHSVTELYSNLHNPKLNLLYLNVWHHNKTPIFQFSFGDVKPSSKWNLLEMFLWSFWDANHFCATFFSSFTSIFQISMTTLILASNKPPFLQMFGVAIKRRFSNFPLEIWSHHENESCWICSCGHFEMLNISVRQFWAVLRQNSWHQWPHLSLEVKDCSSVSSLSLLNLRHYIFTVNFINSF